MGVGTLPLIGFTWGIGGVLLLLSFAVYRLFPMAADLLQYRLTLLHWGALLFSIGYMAWAEGYKGFFTSFAPRVVVRATYLRNHPRPLHVALAPLFCMGYIHATRKRQLMSIGLTTMIVMLVLLVRLVPQPWRGIVDAGVVVGLLIGILSILHFAIQSRVRPDRLTLPAEVPLAHAEP